jgi:hypothetical protein
MCRLSINAFLSFSLQLFFSLPKASHTKKPKVKASSQYSKVNSPPKQKSQKPKVKPQNAEAPLSPSGFF